MLAKEYKLNYGPIGDTRLRTLQECGAANCLNATRLLRPLRVEDQFTVAGSTPTGFSDAAGWNSGPRHFTDGGCSTGTVAANCRWGR